MKKDRIRQFIKLLDRSSMKWPVLFFTVFYLSCLYALDSTSDASVNVLIHTDWI